eukprot:1158223-Pelagomonas_calceolata.AAC.2
MRCGAYGIVHYGKNTACGGLCMNASWKGNKASRTPSEGKWAKTPSLVSHTFVHSERIEPQEHFLIRYGSKEQSLGGAFYIAHKVIESTASDRTLLGAHLMVTLIILGCAWMQLIYCAAKEHPLLVFPFTLEPREALTLSMATLRE